MAGASIEVGLKGDGLQRFADRLHKLAFFDFTGLNLKLGNALRNATLDRFKKEVGPDGEPWLPSGRVEAGKARSAAERGRKGSGKKTKAGRRQKLKTLQDTGRLRSSIHVVATPDEARVGTDVIYARIHQLGGKTGRGGVVELPARPYLGVNEEDRKVLEAIVEDHIATRLR